MTLNARRATITSGVALAMGTLLGAGCVVVAAAAVEAPGILGRGHTILGLIGVWSALCVVATLCLFKAPRRAAVVVIVVLGVAVGVASIAPKAPLSDDLYRYAWDGRVQAHGIDPYRYAPDDLHLASLRDPAWLWPPTFCPKTSRNPCTKINRPSVHTIYPPVAEAYFTALDVTRVTDARDRGLEAAGLLTSLAILAVMLSLLRREGRDPRWAALWALAPLPNLEYVADAHVDGLGLLLTLPALELARRRKPGASGAVLALAALVKLYPALLLPALLVAEWPSLKRMARGVVSFTVVFVIAYVPHVLAVGSAVIGYLPGYLKEEHYDAGSRYLVLSSVGITGKPATGVVVVVLVLTVALVGWRRPPPMVGAVWLYGALLLLTTPVQPWYAAGLAALAIVAGRPEWCLVALAGYPLFVQTILGRADAVSVGEVGYVSAFAVIAVVTIARGTRGTRGKPLVPQRL